MSDFKKIHEELLKPCSYKYRLQSIQNGKATVVAYIDARQLQDRLDEVVGADKWQVKYEENKGNLFAGIGIKINDEWVWKFDCGTESNVEKEKGEASDSFKRAGVMWGVGRFLYSLEILKLDTKKHTLKNGKEKEYPCDNQGNILWTAEDLNAYCHKLANGNVDNKTKTIPPKEEKPKQAAPTKPLISTDTEKWAKAVEWVLKNKKVNLPKIKELYIISDADYKKLEEEVESKTKAA